MPTKVHSRRSTPVLAALPPRTAPLFDIRAAAAYLGTSERHMRRLVAERRITHSKIGGKLRFKCEELDAFIVSNTVTAVPR